MHTDSKQEWITMGTTEDLERVATEVMGWTICPGHQYSSGIIADRTNDDRRRLTGEGFVTIWNPFADARADVDVLVRARAIWMSSYKGNRADPWTAFISSLPRAEYYEVGDYARAALVTLGQQMVS
jgi:hypothetical protein